MVRTISGFLIAALSLILTGQVLAQSGQVTVVTPAAPGQAAGEGARPDGQVGKRGSKPKYVVPLPAEYQAKDKNGDGQIGLYEWDRSKYAEFFKLDKNGDGFLTPQELSPKSLAAGNRMKIGPSGEKDALPNPGNLIAYNQKIGETMTFSVTGRTGGTVWGSGPYTTDSELATAAVHAGILKDGETGPVRVTIVASPPDFAESTANGVSTGNWTQPFAAAFTVR